MKYETIITGNFKIADSISAPPTLRKRKPDLTGIVRLEGNEENQW